MADDYGPGTTVTYAARQAAEEATRTGLPVEKSFNGTPMIAFPGDAQSTVLIRWATERRIIQARRGNPDG